MMTNIFEKTLSIEEAEDVIHEYTRISKDIRAQFNELVNPTNEEKAMYDLMKAISYNMKVSLENYIAKIRQ